MERVQFFGGALFIPIFLVSVGDPARSEGADRSEDVADRAGVLGGRARRQGAGRGDRGARLSLHLARDRRDVGALRLAGGRHAGHDPDRREARHLRQADDQRGARRDPRVDGGDADGGDLLRQDACRASRQRPRRSGNTVLVPIWGESTRPMLALAGRLATPDGGMVMPVGIVTEEATEAEFAVAACACSSKADDWLARDGLRGKHRVSGLEIDRGGPASRRARREGDAAPRRVAPPGAVGDPRERRGVSHAGALARAGRAGARCCRALRARRGRRASCGPGSAGTAGPGSRDADRGSVGRPRSSGRLRGSGGSPSDVAGSTAAALRIGGGLGSNRLARQEPAANGSAPLGRVSTRLEKRLPGCPTSPASDCWSRLRRTAASFEPVEHPGDLVIGRSTTERDHAPATHT